MRIAARVVLLMFIMTILLSMTTFVGAWAAGEGGEQGVVSGVSPQDMMQQSQDFSSSQLAGGISSLGGTALRYLQIVGSIVAVAILALFGIQWFLASPQQKAQLKEKAWSYVIGALLVFGGATVLAWIGNTVQTTVKY